MTNKIYDVAVIGGGIVGTASAMALLEKSRFSLILLEAEEKLAAHQTGNNSGVIHSGLYYKPGSLKALNCVEGRELLYRFCADNGIACERCGKLVVATDEEELPRLMSLLERGAANGLQGIRELTRDQIRDYEPYASGLRGLFVPYTGIVDYVEVTQAYAGKIRNCEGIIQLSTRFFKLIKKDNHFILETDKNPVCCRNIINCAGLFSDRVAQQCGVSPNLQIIPFRGEYYKMKPQRRYLVKNLIYPVPDPRFPFLGVHYTRMIDGEIEMGPNAVLAFKREGYTKSSIDLKDIMEFSMYKGFWWMAAKYWKMGLSEMVRSYSKKAMVSALKKLVPDVESEDIFPAGAGVRAQALESNGFLVDDFRIVQAPHMVHVLNAPSPAATASISIGRSIAQIALDTFR